MNQTELKKTIAWLAEFVWRLEDRDDALQFETQIDQLKAELRKLEEKLDVL